MDLYSLIRILQTEFFMVDEAANIIKVLAKVNCFAFTSIYT